eukprot:CAMPEP_0184014778 /NCGR_PEP_ID=MMETSP0954-20121128/5898_1 /TAXON_ID=627963 /ORGANISM="Aplanochytrium sp, Strain PBS07" /LENGTH=282 /DNA_ID=CAMNT_0026295397 /DNA_START=236 /DNA_END=1081 /DNA_ORIENTATION=+
MANFFKSSKAAFILFLITGILFLVSSYSSWRYFLRFRKTDQDIRFYKEHDPAKNAQCGFASAEEARPEGKRKAYVTTLPNPKDPGRLDRMQEKWKLAYPELEMQLIHSFRNSGRGLAVLVSMLYAVKQAEDDDVDVAIFLEDDAMPFAREDDEPGKWKKEFDEVLREWPTNSAALFLGMHSISTHHPVDLHARVNLLRHGYGAYAIAVRKAHLGCIRDYLQYTLLNPLDSRCLIYNHDIAWWKSDRLFGSQAPAYVATPLLVDHGEGYSLTWNGIRGVESDW